MGPLNGIRIVEIAGLGPAPFCGMMLADHGAEVIRIGRAPIVHGIAGDPARDILNRSRKSMNVNFKHPDGIALVRDLVKSADGLIEGFRPGVMERIGLGPDVLLADNARLVYGRMTGWGQDGPNAARAGHDINYIALSGALHACGREGERPTVPLNLVGDFGGGGMMLAFGMVSAILHTRSTGLGQVIDCAITEGSAVLMAMIYSLHANGRWDNERGVNMLDSGAPYYDAYETADGKFIAVGPIEPQFYREFIDLVGCGDDPDFVAQDDRSRWPKQKALLQSRFRTRNRDEWLALFAGTDACVAPVLSLEEAPNHPHNVARKAFVEVAGMVQPAPAPRYSVTSTEIPTPIAESAESTREILAELGRTPGEIDRLFAAGTIA